MTNPASREAAAQDPTPHEDPVLTFFASAKNAPQEVRSLSLHNFRNYESARIEVSAAPVVLTGKNGAGKTNILEALSLLTPGRGLRRARLGEMDKAASPPDVRCQMLDIKNSSSNIQHLTSGIQAWVISANIHGQQGEAHVGTARAEEDGADKRLVRIDGKIAPQSHLARHISILWLTPQTEQLFHDGASAGRKFLDRLAYGFDSEHAARVSEYEYAMRERNKLLQTGYNDAAWLEALESTMAETAAAIAVARLETVFAVNAAIDSSPLSFTKALMEVEGFAENLLKAGAAQIEVEEKMKSALAAGRREDAAAGRALLGAHKSRLGVFHRQKRAPAEACSTGEQKALLLSIMLAEARAAARKKGAPPVLLLDEVAAHLDAIKRFELFEEICDIGAQTWMTGTDEKLFADLKGKAQFLRVENGVKNDDKK